jgi:CheY-like chemotaxis protein
MSTNLKMTIVDDNAAKDPFYPALIERIRQELPYEPIASLVDAELLLPLGFFDPKRAIDELRRTAPDLIVMDLVLHESNGRHDLTLADWLTTAIRRDPMLQAVLLVYISNFFGDHYPVPRQWLRWCFGKQALLTDEETWALFHLALANPAEIVAQQVRIRSLPKTLLREQRRQLS